ncbi:hypothetical protein GOB43_17815 [Sinorhizobium meliloti]|uniref:deoxynucleotide monophosphate kinase family protein n=1 Tax=Rhizobium meliloti TaxID=382 RepID=UPI000FD4FB60|nr:hypothetical protein [Sinorhizobium meliloti]MDW9519121.1 hypothetical protein [Sinorhizobium meliloti]RVG58468.1 hypothetical protein CN224_15835 [Sinorhizobium meliloti]RVM00643.1 hypothetical protein CN136_04135 [Sinorhizobium meliloti]
MVARLIGITGQAGSGKSEVSRFLADFGYTLVKFAAPLKDMLRSIYVGIGLTSDEIERRIEGDLKEVPCPYLSGQTPRHAMVTLGTEWGRVLMAPDFWIERWADRISTRDSNVVTDDVRFENEAKMLRSRGGIIIRVVPAVARRQVSTHVSEAGIPDHLVDHEIVNDGTISDLRRKVYDLLFPNVVETFGDLGE